MFLAVRGLVSVLVGPVFGETTPHFPLYLAEAGLVELVGLGALSRRPLAFGALCGALIGTAGLLAEWGWSHVWMPLPWPDTLFADAAPLALVAAVAGGLIGGLIGATLASDRIARPRGAAAALALASVAIAGVVGYGLHTTSPGHERAQVTLTDVSPAPNRTVSARIVLTPAGAAKDAGWLTVTAWQGGGFVLDRLHRVGDGVYRTTKPIPVHGNWKALLRLHRGDSLEALPIYLPRDTAIPAPETPAQSRFTRSFVSDKKVLQREAKETSPWLAAGAYTTVLAIALVLFGGMAWGLRRLALAGRAGWEPPRGRGRPSGKLAPAR
jgi:hypothetical protein